MADDSGAKLTRALAVARRYGEIFSGRYGGGGGRGHRHRVRLILDRGYFCQREIAGRCASFLAPQHGASSHIIGVSTRCRRPRTRVLGCTVRHGRRRRRYRARRKNHTIVFLFYSYTNNTSVSFLVFRLSRICMAYPRAVTARRGITANAVSREKINR